jgi:serine/threonine protein phosphatase PrpC
VNASFYVGCRMTEAESTSVASGTAFVFSHSAPDRPESDLGDSGNEDAAMVLTLGEGRGLLAIADGMGGQRLGGVAARAALESLQESIFEAVSSGVVEQHPDAGLSALEDDHPRPKRARGTEGGVLREPILTGFEAANRAVTALGVGAGTTLAAVEIDDACLRTYHVGDSMILVVGQRGKLKLQTVAHSPVGYAVEAGMIGEEEAIHHEDRHLISNMVGSTDMRIDIGPVLRLRERDTLLLATDGLFDNLRLDEIISLIRKGPLHEVARRLSEAARHRMVTPEGDGPSKPDDLTFVLFRVGALTR